MILGVDPGTKRIGLAIADDETRFARPLEVIDTTKSDPVERIAELAGEHTVHTVVVGRPLSLSGHAGPAVDAQQQFVAQLRDRLNIEVVECDERLSTVAAEQGLRASGAARKARRGAVDAVAAQLMLQTWLDAGG
jgi:putative Holliday junction resolvase